MEITVNYPLLTPEFPRSAEYARFYHRIAQEVRKRGMTLFVKVEAMFVDPAVSNADVDYTGITFEILTDGKRQQIETVLKEMRPDFMTISMEPDTVAFNTGLIELRDADRTAEMVILLLNGLDKGNTLIGAGAGTWEDQEFIEKLSSIPNLDYIDLHIYPLSTPFQDFLQQAIVYTDIAKRNGKMVVIGETWLYKSLAAELVSGGSESAINSDIFRRDTFSFWEPLDQKFLEVITKLGNYKQFEFISFFWSGYLFGYLDIAETDTSLSTNALLALANQAAVKGLIAGEISGTGQAYKDIIDSN